VLRGVVTSAGWQVTLCDPIWYVSSSIGVATSVSDCYIRVTLLYFYMMKSRGPRTEP